MAGSIKCEGPGPNPFLITREKWGREMWKERRKRVKESMIGYLHAVPSFSPKEYAGLTFLDKSWAWYPVRLGKQYLLGPGPAEGEPCTTHHLSS